MVLVHTSHKKIHKLKNISQESEFKPSGMWYAPNKIWYEFAKKRLKESFKERTKFVYIIKPVYTSLDKKDPNKVLQIKDNKTFDEFTLTYGKKHSGDLFSSIMIDWANVEKNYGGIEVIPFLKKRSIINYPDGQVLYNAFKIDRNKEILSWLYGWDIASGCIWNSNAVKEFIELKPKK